MAAPTASDTPLVDGSDFSSLKVSIGWTVTAKRPGLRGVREGDEPRVIEFRDEGALLDLPAGSGQVGDRVLFQLQARAPDGRRATFSSPAQIESVDLAAATAGEPAAAPADRIAVTVRYLLANPSDWAQFRKFFEERQVEIDTFLKAARGY